MSNYRESSASGTSHVRAHTVVFNNQEQYKSAEFHEEKVIVMEDGEVIRKRTGAINESFTVENSVNEFPVIDPISGQDTGATATYGQVYALLYSLYLELAVSRDEEVAAAEVARLEAEAARLEAEAAAEAARLEAEAAAEAEAGTADLPEEGE